MAMFPLPADSAVMVISDAYCANESLATDRRERAAKLRAEANKLEEEAGLYAAANGRLMATLDLLKEMEAV